MSPATSVLVVLFFFLLVPLKIVSGAIPKNPLFELNFDRFNQTSSKCKSQFDNLNPEILVRMFDASVKFPEGILAQDFWQLGNFDECYDIANGSVYGKYCLGSFAIDSSAQHNNSEQLRPLRDGFYFNAYHLGICVPSGCTAADLAVLTNYLVFTDDHCSSQDTKPELTGGAIAVLTFLGFFLFLLAASTIYETTLLYSGGKKPGELLLAFSALSNGKKLLASTSNPDQLLCLNGLKAISMMWVVLNHEYLLSLNGPLLNYGYIEENLTDPTNMYIVGSAVSVDTFFAIGGLVTVYVFLKSMDKGAKFNVGLYYLHRYIRLTPALAVIILIHATLLQYTAYGPTFYSIEDPLIRDCREHWWAGLLYLQNFFHGNGTCVPQSWYLSVDFQLFLLSPLVLIPLQKWPKLAFYEIGILVLAGIAVPMAITYAYELAAFMSNGGDYNYMWMYYKQTHTRFGPYVIGMGAGYLIYKLKNSKNGFKLNWVVVTALWILSLTGLTACLYGGYDLSIGSPKLWPNVLFNGFSRSAWAVSLCMLIFICVAGYGGPLDWFLSLPIFQLLTKLSYSMYLVHYSIITIRFASAKTPYRFTIMAGWWSYWGDFMLTLALSTILSLTFEFPMVTLEKFIFGSGSKPSKKERKPEV